jgi:AcrR family transcriptional regulator
MNAVATKSDVSARPRAPRADSAVKRARILDCAERLFALHGYHGTSVRDIAQAADVQFALVGYHFGSKQDLLDRVIERRSTVLNADRRAFLARAREDHGDRPIPLPTLLDGFIGSIIRRAAGGDVGWHHYTQLIAAIAGAEEWSDLTHRHFNEVAREYLTEIQRLYPAASEEALIQAFFFSTGAMVAVCARPGRIETLSAGRFRSNDVSHLYKRLCLFLEGGFDRVLTPR